MALPRRVPDHPDPARLSQRAACAARLRRRPLTLAAFAGLGWHAGWPGLPRGASQKAMIALYPLWLALTAARLRDRTAWPRT